MNYEDAVCAPCHAGCKQCSNDMNLSCSSCRSGFYLQPDSFTCLHQCPTGFTRNDLTNECEGVVDEVLCIEFNLRSVDWSDADSGVDFIGGTSAIEGGTAPLPVYHRGIYFEDSFLTIGNLILNHTWTITLWIRPDSSSGNLFSVNTNANTSPGSEQYINLMITTGYRP